MIEFKNVVKKFGQKTAINGVDLTIAKGDFVCIIGRSGSGKTTMLRMINRLIEPTSGNILINNADISQENIIKLRRNIGYVVQHTGLFPNMTVKENIEIIPKLESYNGEQTEAKTYELLDMVGLSKALLDRYPDELSGGQQQRVGIARAFAVSPDVILMDEPFSALDPITKSELQEQTSQICKEHNKTIVFVTHDMDEALKISDKVCIMQSGKIIQYDTPENIIKMPASEYVTDMVGKNRIWSSPEFLTVFDIMVSPITVLTGTSIKKSIEKMKNRRVDNLLITEKNGKLRGLVTARRIMQYSDKDAPIDNIMLTEFVKSLPDGKVLDILKVIDESDISCVPVADEQDILQGIVTRGTLLTLILNQNK